MLEKVNDILNKGDNLRNEGKAEEALELIGDFKKSSKLSQLESLKLNLFCGYVIREKFEFEKAMKLAEELYKESLKLNKPFLAIEAVFIKFLALFGLWRTRECWKDVENCEKLLKSADNEPLSEYNIAKAIFFYMRGFFHFWEGTYDLAIDYQHKSVSIFEQHNRFWDRLPTALWVIAESKNRQGELEIALTYHLKSLNLCKGEDFVSMGYKSANLCSIGLIYQQQGKLDLAIEYHEKSLEILCRFPPSQIITGRVGIDYASLIDIAIDKNAIELAKKYLQQLQEYIEGNNTGDIWGMYSLARARILRASSRTRDRADAEKILIQLIEGNDKIQPGSGLPREFTSALIELCEMYIEELQATNDLGILDDIQPLIERLTKETKLSNSHSLHSHSLLLRGQLSLLQMNFGEARSFLNLAQKVAEDHGLVLLARSISSEHDKLLETLKKWDSIKKTQASVAERLKLASVDEIIDRMQGKLAIEPLDPIEEQPVLLLILVEENILILSYPFSEKWKQDDTLVGSFLSAFSTFQDEYLSQGLDRAKFGGETLLIQSIDSFLVCYLFRGQTYSAKQKINFFLEALNKDNHSLGALKNAVSTRQIIKVSDNPRIEELIVKSFTTDPDSFQTPFKAYTGDEPFVFASYAHTNKLEVYPVIDYLNKMNIKIWYDEGIPISENWKKSIAVNLERSSAFLVFITPQIINSEYVRKEISFALKKRKPFFAVYLKDTKLPTELEFEIADIQAMMMYLMPKSEFQTQLKDLLSGALNI